MWNQGDVSRLNLTTYLRTLRRLFNHAQLRILCKMNSMKSESIGIEESASIMGVSVGTLRRRVADGTVKTLPSPPLLKKPKKLLFYREEIEKLATRRSE